MQPVFIGGLGRSGTTLLADVMGFHPELSPVYETAFVVKLIRLLSYPAPYHQVCHDVRALMDTWTKHLPHRPDNKREYERYAHGAHHVLFSREYAMHRTQQLLAEIAADPVVAVRGFVLDLFREHANIDGKPGWVSKVPAYLQHAPVLRLLFPELVMVHIVRDVRDVVASTLTRSWGPRTARVGAQHWVAGLQSARAFSQRYPGQLVEVRYEDLLREPEGTLRTVFSGIGLELPSDLVARYAAAADGFQPSRIGAGRRDLSSEDLRTVAEVAGPTLEAWGYPTSDLLTAA